MESALKKFYSDVAAVVKKDLEKQKMLLPPDVIAELCSEHHRQHRNCRDALFSAEARNGNAAKKIVCAVQKAFPQAGIVRNEYDFLQSAQYYEAHYHAAALAVFTEKHFYEGAPKMLTGITHLVKIPVIRWDFIVDEYQLMQSKLWGADAVRILPSLLDQSELLRFANIASELDLEFIIEAVDPVDIERSIIIETVLLPCQSIRKLRLESIYRQCSRRFQTPSLPCAMAIAMKRINCKLCRLTGCCFRANLILLMKHRIFVNNQDVFYGQKRQLALY